MNAICLQRPGSLPRAEGFVRATKGLNRGQGLGFVVLGQVCSKRTLWLIGSGLYAAVGAFGPTLLGEFGLESPASGSGMVGAQLFTLEHARSGG